MLECIMAKELQGRKLKVQRASIGKRNEQVNTLTPNGVSAAGGGAVSAVQEGKSEFEWIVELYSYF